MNNKATMTDIAKLAGVSQPTVSLILRGKNLSSFPAETVNRVLDACRELNYVTKPKKTSGENQSKEILVLTTKMTNPYYPAMLQSIDREALKHGLHVVACNTYYSHKLEHEFLSMAVEKNFLAVIFTYAPGNIDAVRKFHVMIPIIAICDRTSDIPTDKVELNDVLAGRIAADYLLSLGHRCITFIAGNVSSNYSRKARLRGIEEAMTSYGMDAYLNVISDSNEFDDSSDENFDYNCGYNSAKDTSIVKLNSTAIIAVNDTYALGVIDALTEMGISVPGDISVVGFNNLLYASVARIPITTVDNYSELLAQAAIDVLLHRLNIINGGDSLVADTKIHIECRPRLIVRKSTGQAKET